MNTTLVHLAAPTITELMHRAIRAQIEHPKPDVVLNIESHLFNVALTAESAEYDLDVGKNLWLNRQRWSRLIKEYLEKEAWQLFRTQCGEIISGTARLGATGTMQFRRPVRSDKKHRWGGCLLGASFRGDNNKAGKATLTFFSRTTYIGYMGLLDAGIAHVMARLIAEQKPGWTEKDISFRWHISSSQLHGFKTLPFVFSQPDLIKKLERLERNRNLIKHGKVSPTWYHMAKWYCKITDAFSKAMTESHGDEKLAANVMVHSEKYGPFKRIKRRWLEFKGYLNKHVPPSLNINDLDFEKAI